MELGAVVKEQYRVIEHIGRGGMADVWSARDLRLRRMVAIKTIAAGLTADVDPVSLFEKEAQTIAQMEHPHILPIYDFGEYEHNLYIVMRYVTGGSLEHLLRQGPLEPDEVLRMGDSIGRALDHAHENNVIHLDLKPPNILLDSSHVPYLADFGLATVLDPEGRARNPGSGTLLYMAPEQLVAETIDHRADIYSFSIMLFHMLTGHLPFDGSAPLAIRQMQSAEMLPDLDRYVSGLPHELGDLLRLGTAQEPSGRPYTHREIMDQFRAIVQPSAPTIGGFPSDFIAPVGEEYFIETQRIESTDSALLEAVDLYSRARYDWQGGQGRFLLGVTHFMLMSDYYQNADYFNLLIDSHGYQMLLRGALEYDYELDYWWKQIKEDDRRWVCLHALRSGNSPARIRALYRLETLSDQEGNPVIPKLVAQALEIEADPNAKIAALKVLGTRAKLIRRPTMNIMTQYRGRLLTSITRLGIELAPPASWQEVIYSQEVDTLIAETTFDEDEHVAEFAARTVGRMRSLAAVQHLSTEQINNRPGALQALAFIRDEAPALPDVVTPQARFYAWITNTVRRLTDEPLQLIWRFVVVLLGGWIAMGEQVYNLFRSQQLFTAQRWANTIAMGLVFGLLIAVTHLFTDEMSRRLRGFWPWWMRLLVSGLLGYLMATLSYGGFRWLFMQDPAIMWDLMRLAGFSLALALCGTAMLRLSGWQAVGLTTVMGFAPILASHLAYYYPQDFTILPLAPFALIIGVLFGWRAAQLSPLRDSWQIPGHSLIRVIVGAVIGLVWMAAAWLYYTSLLGQLASGQPFTWDTVLLSGSLAFVSAMLITYWLHPPARIAFLLSGLAAFVVVYVLVSWQFFDFHFDVPLTTPPFSMVYYNGVPLRPLTDQPVFNYDFAPLVEVYFVSLPMFLVLALGANLFPLMGGWLSWIGTPSEHRERGGWLASGLLYTLILSALVSVLSLFSSKVSIPWALGWSLWGFVTFVCALAAYRWAKWGARALIWCGIVLIAGGFLFDYVNMRYMASQFTLPALLQTIPLEFHFLEWSLTLQVNALTFWAVWAVFIGLFAWGALRQRLWGGIGLVAMLVAWFVLAIFSPIQGSIAIFAMTSVAYVLYTLAPKYALMEEGRFRIPAFLQRTAEPVVTAPPTVLGRMPFKQMVEDTLGPIEDEFPDRVGMGALHTELSADPMATGHLTTTQETPVVAEPPAIKLNTSELRNRAWQRLETEMEPGLKAGRDGERPRMKLDTGALQSRAVAGDETEYDPAATPVEDERHHPPMDTPALQSFSGMQTEMDPAARPPTESQRPRLKLDTGALKSRAGQSGDSEPTEPEKPASEPERPRLKLDTGALKSRAGQGMETELDPGAKAGDEPERPRLKLDTGALKSRAGQNMETELDPGAKLGGESERPRLKIDTGALKSRAGQGMETELDPGAKLGGEPERPRLKIDTGALKSRAGQSAEPEKPEEPADQPDDDSEE